MTSQNPPGQTHVLRRIGSISSLMALIATFFVLMPAAPASAAVPTILPIGPNGAVTASAFDPTSAITYVGGSFTRWGTQTGSGAGITASGALRTSFPMIAGGSVMVSISDGAGGFYIGGSFTSVGGETHNRLARILSTGAVDSEWRAGASDTVRTMALSGSTLYVGGSFTSVTSSSGTTSSRARLAAFSDTGSVLAWAPNVSDTVSAIVVRGDSVFVGGSFKTTWTTPGGTASTRRHLAAFDAAGAGALRTWAPAADAPVNAMALSGTTLYVGGSFSTISAVGGTAAARGRLAAISIGDDGTLETWSPSVDGPVTALALNSATVFIGGSFTTMASGGGGEAQSRTSIGAVGTSGVGALRRWAPSLNGAVSALDIIGSSLYVGGSFTSVTPIGATATTRNRAAEFTLGTGELGAWNPDADGAVATIIDSGSTIFLGGSFTMLGGSVRSGLAAIDSSGALTSWAPSVSGGAVKALAVADSRVFVGGAFTSASGQGTSASVRYRAAAFAADTGALTSWAPTFDGGVYALAVVGSTLYLAGEFSNITPVGSSGVTRNRLAAVSTTGTGTVSSWVANLNDTATSLAISDSVIYVGGSFTQIAVGGGSWTTRNRVAAVNLAGNGSLSSWAPGFNSTITALTLSGSTVYVAGHFNQIYSNGSWVNRTRLAAVGTNGTFTSWAPVPNDRVDSILIDGSTAYLAGAFTSITPSGGSAASRSSLAAVSTTGAGSMLPWAPVADGVVNAISRVSADSLRVIGSFNGITGTGVVSRAGIAEISIDGQPSSPGSPTLVSAGVDNLTITWTPPSSTWNPVTSYDVSMATIRTGTYATPAEGTCAASVNTNSCMVTGLNPKTRYFFKVVAHNLDGDSPESNPSTAMLTTVAGGGPGKPTNVRVTPGDTTIGVTWDAPTTDGGRTITGYVVCLTDIDTCQTLGASVRSSTFFGLTNGESHEVEVSVITGDGRATSDPITTAARTIPSAPALQATNPSPGTVALTWTTPESDGGSAIVDHRVCVTSLNCRTVSGTTLTATFTGLSNTSYTPTVVARNAAGNSTAGTASITPTTVPAAPSPVTVVMSSSNTVATVSWSGSTANGGSAITGYTVCLDGSCRTVGAATTSSQFTGQTNGVAHVVTVVATSALGDSTAARGYTTTAGTAVAKGATVSGNMTGWNLSGFDLTNTNFSNANLTNVDFRGATINNTNFSSANLTGADFSGVTLLNLREKFRSANLTNTKFVGANLTRGNDDPWGEAFPYAILNGTDFTNANLTNQNFVSIASNSFTNVVFAGATLTGMDLRNAKLTGFSFAGMNLTNTNFGGANLTNVDFRGATINATNFSSANLTGADFSGNTLLNLREKFRSANLTNTKFVGANLTRGNDDPWGDAFPYAILDGTDFTNANLTNQNFVSIASNSFTNVVFAGAALTGMDLRNAKLTGFSFAGMNLTNTNFGGANLTNVDFRGATINATNFSSANLTGADFSGNTMLNLREKFNSSNLTNTKFVGANLTRGNDDPWGEAFSWAVMNGTDFTNANLTNQNFVSIASNSFTNVVFTGATLVGLDLRNAKLTGFSFAGMNLTNTNFGGANLTNVDFRGATINATNFSSANLTGADFSGVTLLNLRSKMSSANLTNTKFVGANLTRGNDDPWGEAFSYAILNGTDFTNANLTRQNFSGVANNTLTNVVFRGATLTGLDLRNAKMPGVSLAGLNLTSVNFGAATLTGANLRNADLTNADFGSAKLSNVDFRGTTMKNTRFWGANLTNANFSGLTFSTMRSDQFTYADLTGAKFVGASLPSPHRCDWETFHSTILNGTDFTNANLTNTCFNNVASNSFTGVKLAGATIKSSSFGAAKLDGFVFTGLDLTDVDFGSSKLTGADFRGTTMKNTRFWGANLTNANFSGLTFSTMRSDQFTYADLTGAKFVGASLPSMYRCDWQTFHSSILNGTDFTNANLTNTCFNNIASNSFTGVKFAGATIKGSSFGAAKLDGFVFTGLDLTDVDFGSSKLTGADFRGTTMKNTRFWGANLTNANFSGLTFSTMRSDQFTYADLTGAKFVGASLPSLYRCDWQTFHSAILNGTDFTNANLTNTCFNNIASNSFTGVKFAGANIQGSSFGAAKLDGFDFTGLNLTNVDFGSSKLTGADFRSTTMNNTRFWGATLVNANFSGVSFANPRSDQFTYADLTGAKFVGSTLLTPSGCDWNTFHTTVLNGTDFTNATLTGMCFARISGSQVINVNFTGAGLRNTNFSGMNLGASVFTNAVITSSNLSNANFSGVFGVGAQGTSITTNGSTQLPPMWRITSGTLYVTKAPSDAPVITSTVGGDGSITVEWTAPTTNSGDAITGYNVCLDSACSTENAAARSKVFTSILTPGTKTVTVAARNAGGNSPSASITTSARTVPAAPVLSATGISDRSLTLSWSAPSVDGGYAVSGYRACIGAVCRDLDSSTLSTTFDDLTGGTQYTLRVSASNQLGSSLDAVTTAVPTPFVAPSTPKISVASLDGSTMTLSWDLPTSDGGSGITLYRVCFETLPSCRAVAAPTRTITVTLTDVRGLFTVSAVNGIGISETSRGLIVDGVVVRPGASLVGRDLRGVDLSGLDLRGINLTNADLRGADLSGALLNGANLTGADLGDVRLVRADLSGANLTGATMTGVNLSFAVLSGTTDFTSVVGTGAEGSRIVGATALLPAIWSISAGKLLVMVEPSAPSVLGVSESPGSITVNWREPGDDGGGAILGYRVCVVTIRCETFAASRGSATLNSVPNGSTYSVTVEARNAAGYSPTAGGSVTLAGAPGAPGDVRVEASAGALTVRWARPGSSGGSPITGYSVCAGVSCVSVGAGDRVGVVSGLVNGQTYAVVVYALSAYGTSVGGSGGSSVPFTSPSAVSISSIEGSDRTVTIGWSTAFNGGSALTGYEVCAVPASGRKVCADTDPAAVSAVLTGLSNGVEYTVSVVARNAAGAGAAATRKATPSTVATIPRISSATMRPGGVDVVWSAPSFDGGAALVRYELCADSTCVNVSASSTSGSVTGLTNGSTYSVTVKAVNRQGSSGTQAVPVTLAGAPGAPGDVRVEASAGALTVRWARPGSSGGSPITGYSVCAGVSCVSVGAGDRVGVVSGLVNGQTYAVVVYALSAYGTSVGGSGGSSVPFTSPSAVSISSIEGSDRTVTIGWSTAFNGGSALTGYDICAAPPVGDPVCVKGGPNAVSATLTGLSNGVEYTASVVARNAAGESAAAARKVTPSRTPRIPRNVVAQPGPGVILLTWDPPIFDGGATLSGYSVCLGDSCVSVAATANSYRFEGLTNGTKYTVSVLAINSNGPSNAVIKQSTPRLGLSSLGVD